MKLINKIQLEGSENCQKNQNKKPKQKINCDFASLLTSYSQNIKS
ncbi:MAG: hypothetical protein ACJA0S_000127 [Rickettsiales bacterium]|jgi:hypothetical protein